MTNAEIQVGEYVRTKDGYISKVKEVTDDWIECESAITKHYEDTFDSLYPDEFDTITNHSFDLIDLIEAGDYVNGDKVDMLTEIGGGKVIVCNDYNLDDSAIFYNNEKTKTVVTKEQFKNMEYKVGGEDD